MDAGDLLDTEHDRVAFGKLADVVASRQALALVGAGFSARAGYPGWNDLLDRMAAHLQAQTARISGSDVESVRTLPPNLTARYEDVLWRAEELRSRLHDDAYFELLTSTFGVEPQADECVDMLARLPFRHLLTTNYDFSLERTHARLGIDLGIVKWGEERDVLRMMFSLLQPDSSRQLVYLHGRIDDQSSLVLTDQDYSRQYLRSDSTVRKLFALFAMQRIVFFGFSLTDPDLTAILRQVAGALGYDEPRHFAFVPLDPQQEREVDRKRLARKFGIQAVFYNRANRHARLRDLMALLVERCGGKPAPPTPQPTKVAKAAPPPAREMLADAISAGAGLAGARATRHGLMNPDIPDDPRKGMFGGQSHANGRVLAATVTQVPGEDEWFDVALRVVGTSGAPPLAGKVTFYLHPTFPTTERVAIARDGEAHLALRSYGAFTVGAVADGGATTLELDLATLRDAPRKFRES